mgnify:CR=1 FL=1
MNRKKDELEYEITFARVLSLQLLDIRQTITKFSNSLILRLVALKFISQMVLAKIVKET